VTARRLVPLIAFIALAIYAGVLSWQLDRAQGRELAARVAIQKTKLEAAGWEQAAEKSQRELATAVPALEKEIEAAKAAKVPMLASNRTKTDTVTFDIPLGIEPPSPAAGAGETAAAASPQPTGTTAPVGVSADVQTAVVGLDDGTIEWKSRVFATVSWGALKVPGECGKGEPCETKELPVKTAKSTTGVDPDLVAAWKAFKNPPPRFAILPRGITKWRAGWFVGPGLAVALDGRVSAGVLVGWGVQL